MTYTQKQVDRGIKLVAGLTKNKRDLGLLALEIVPKGTPMEGMEWATSPLKTELEEFAIAIGVEPHRFREYRRIVATYINKRGDLRWRDDLAFDIHRTIAAASDPIKMLHQRQKWTYPEAQRALGRVPTADRRLAEAAGQKVDSGPLISSEEAVQQALKADPYMAKRVIRKAVTEDDILARAIVEDQGTRVALGKATMDRSRDMVDRQKLTQSPAQTRRDEQIRWMDTIQPGNTAVLQLREFLRSLEGAGALDERQRGEVAYVVERVQTCLDFLNAFINGGSKPLADQLAEFLEGT